MSALGLKSLADQARERLEAMRAEVRKTGELPDRSSADHFADLCMLYFERNGPLSAFKAAIRKDAAENFNDNVNSAIMSALYMESCMRLAAAHDLADERDVLAYRVDRLTETVGALRVELDALRSAAEAPAGRLVETFRSRLAAVVTEAADTHEQSDHALRARLAVRPTRETQASPDRAHEGQGSRP